MEMFEKRLEKKRVYRLEDEREFFSLIERRLKEQGYQLLDTLQRITNSGPLETPHYST